MSQYQSLLRYLFVFIIYASGISSSFAQYLPVIQQCQTAYEKYSVCQQMEPELNESNIQMYQKGSNIEFCKKANEFWLSSGCAAQSQCMQNNGLPSWASQEVIQQFCPFPR